MIFGDSRRLLMLTCGATVSVAFASVLLVVSAVLSFPLSQAGAWAVLAAAALAGVATMLWARAVLPPCSPLTDEAYTPPAETSRSQRWSRTAVVGASWAALVGGLGLLIVGAYCSATAPDLNVDAGCFHLPAVHEYLRHGHLVWVDERYPFANWINGYPKGAEALSFLFCRASGSSSLSRWGNFPFVIVGALAVGALASWLGARPAGARLATGLFLCIPASVTQYYASKPDGASAGAISAAAALLVITVVSLRRLPLRATVMLAVTLGAATGLSLITKSVGVGVAGLVGMVMAAAVVCYVVAPPAAAGVLGVESSFGARLRKAAGVLALSATVSVCVGGYWYARNYQKTGSPLYPAGLKVAGHEVFPGPTVMSIMSHMVPKSYVDKPWYQRVLLTWSQVGEPGHRYPSSITSSASQVGGLGWMWILGGVPATVWALWRYKPRYPVLVLVLMIGVLFLITPMNFRARYTIFLAGLGLPLLGWAMTCFGRRAEDGRSRAWAPAWWSIPLAMALVLEIALMFVVVIRNNVTEIGWRYDGIVGEFRHLRWAGGDVAVTDLSEPIAQSVGLSAMNPPGERAIYPLGKVEAVTPELLAELSGRGVMHLVVDTARTRVPAGGVTAGWTVIEVPERRAMILTRLPVTSAAVPRP